MTRPIFTLDLEDHRPDAAAEIRFPAVTDELLDDLDEWGVTGTVFVVGEVVASHPDLVARVAARGHEMGLHAARHVPLPEVGPESFRVETRDAVDRLSQVVQSDVAGFRAPIYSLVPESFWATEILPELGFVYSSSVLPAANPLFGWHGAPEIPFRWPSGLIELPAPVFGVGRLKVPVLGGAYLRVAPWPLVEMARRRVAVESVPWIYAHPYDFDPEEPRWLIPEVGRIGSRLMWWGRKGMRHRVERLAARGDHRLADIAADLADHPDDLEVFPPEAAPPQPLPETR